MKIRRCGKNSFEISFDSSRKDQVRATHLFDAFSGREPTLTCEVCGGVTEDNGPERARCVCANPNPAESHEVQA